MSRRAGLPSAWRLWGAFAVAVIPLFVALVKYVGTTQRFNADPSVFGINVHDTTEGSFPSTEFSSRYVWSHPGPVAFCRASM